MTVKEFIEKEQTVRGSYSELSLDNPHLSNLQHNEIIFVEGVPHVKTSIIFGGSQAPDTVAKIEDLEIKNARLELELSYLQVKYESAQMRSEALQNYVKNSTAETQRQSIKKQKEITTLQTKVSSLEEKVSGLEDTIAKLIYKAQAKQLMITNLTAKNQKFRHRSQLFSELTHDIYKLNQKYQNMDTSFVVEAEENNDI
jgi:chromosome segregation ATPase